MNKTNQNFQLRYNYDDTNTPQPSSYSFSSAQVAAFYGSGSYGTSAYGSSGFPLERISVEGSGFVVAFKLNDESTRQALSLRGFELEYVNRGRSESTRLNSSHITISYAVFCLKKKRKKTKKHTKTLIHQHVITYK